MIKLTSASNTAIRHILAVILLTAYSLPALTQQIPVPGTPPAPAQKPPTGGPCNAACKSAIGKEYVVVGFSGNSSNVAFWDQTHSKRYLSGSWYKQSSVSSPPTAPYSFLGVSGGSYVASVLMDLAQYQSFGLASGTPNFNPSMVNGFSFGMMVYVEDPSVKTATNTYYTFVTNATAQQPTRYLTAIRKGSQWGLSVLGTSGPIPIYQYPWDANSFQTQPGWNYVFYTITPDGKCRIDVFYNSTYNSALLDFGNVGLGYNSGTATSNPQPPQYPQQDSTVSYAFFSTGKGFESLELFSSPLTPAEASGFYQGSYQGTYTDQGGTACNTGFALNVQTIGSNPPTSMPDTPCGSTSNWSNASPPAAAVSLSTRSLSFQLQAGSQGASTNPQGVTLTNTGMGPLNISGIAIGGSDPGDFSETDNCVGTISAGASCVINAVFTDNNPNGGVATVQITSNARSSPDTIQLDGQTQ